MIILFDIDDTLFPSTEFSSLARKNALNAMLGMGLDCSYTDLSRRLDKIIEKYGSNYDKHFDKLCKQLKVKDSGKYVAAAIAAYHDTKTAIQPFPTVPLTLITLKERGHRLYVATRGKSTKQWDKLIRLRLALFFDGVFVSEKKDSTFYRSVLKKLHVSPSECIMVGDREDADIAPAKQVGIITVRLFHKGGKYSNSKDNFAQKKTHANYSISDLSGILKIL